MTRRLLDLDDDLLARAQAALGTPTMTATVREALARVTATDPGEAYVEALLALPDLRSTTRQEAWRTGDG
jgi:Arc/MetJ family transcription regulator